MTGQGDLDDLEAAIVEAIVAACPSDEACAAAGLMCLDVHPIHSVVSVRGVTVVVEANVDAIAKMAVRVMRERAMAPCWGCRHR